MSVPGSGGSECVELGGRAGELRPERLDRRDGVFRPQRARAADDDGASQAIDRR